MGLIGGIIGGAAGLAGSIFGGISASKAMRGVKNNLQEQQRRNQDWYNQRYNEDATQRADAQAILTRTEEAIKARNRAAAGAAAVTGGTEESVAATKAANAQAMAEAASNISVNAERYFSQPFCQYLWSVAFYLPIFFNTFINFPIYLKLGVLTPADRPNSQAMEFADHIFFIARRLKDTNFNPNVINAFPSVENPKEFSAEIENANTIYCGALTFMFSHEFSHQYLGHTRIENTYSRSIKDEIAADDTAVDFLKPEFDEENGRIYQTGIVTLLAALLLSDKDSISGGGTHPDMDIRISMLY